MRLLSLNLWGGRLHERLIPYLTGADPDVLCLQEVTRMTAPPCDWLTYRDGDLRLPQRADLFGELRRALPDHEGAFCAAARGDLFDGDKAVPSDWGIATFVRRSIPVIGQRQDFVHGGFRFDGWGPHPRARNAHAVRLHDARGFAVTIAHMHGLRDPSGKGDTPARQAQAEALVALVTTVARPSERLVVCGDFNLLPDSATFAALARLGLADLVVAKGHRDTRTSFYAKPGRFADYMLVNSEVAVRSFDVVAQPEVSDHRPLLLDLG